MILVILQDLMDPSDPFGIDDSGQEDTSDSFDANMGLSNQEIQNIFGVMTQPHPHYPLQDQMC